MKVNWVKIQIISIFLFFVLLPFNACDSEDDNIPYVIVSFSLDLNVYNQLTTPGYSMMFENEGYGGVIVFCEYYDVTAPGSSIYYAFDAGCTYDAEFEESDTCSCSLSIIDNGASAICPCCSSEYSLYGGYPYKGDATVGLRQYNASVLNNKLYVSN